MGKSEKASGGGLEELTMHFDFQSIVRLEEEYKINLMENFEGILQSPSGVSKLAWAGLLHSHPNLKREELWPLLKKHGVDLSGAIQLVSQGLVKSFKGDEDEQEPETPVVEAQG